MDIINFFQKIFTGGKGIELPTLVKQEFEKQFSNSLNIEWQKNGDLFEAVFYINEAEHIAVYKNDGASVCLKINLPLIGVPENIQHVAKEEGELMNAIQIECDGILKYELIVRDKNLVRYSLLLNEKGTILKKEKL